MPTDVKQIFASFADTIEIRDYMPETIRIGKSEFNASRLSEREVKILVNELNAFVFNMHPPIRDMFITAGPAILNLIRAINEESGQGFLGQFGRSKELTFNAIVPEDIVSTTRTWAVTIGSVAAADWLASSGTPVSVGEEQGFAIIGIANPVAEPKTHRYIFVKNQDALPHVTVNWDSHESNVVALKEPILVAPEESWYARTFNEVIGTDKAQPIGLKIEMAKDTLVTTFT
jgi:hypothetical protein